MVGRLFSGANFGLVSRKKRTELVSDPNTRFLSRVGEFALVNGGEQLQFKGMRLIPYLKIIKA